MEKDCYKLKIALDLDSCVLDFEKAYTKLFPSVDWSNNEEITFNVELLKFNKLFWSNLDLLENPDFIPHCYCTKRINSVKYTISNLKKVGLPIRPIYQLRKQHLNKGKVLQDVCDVLIDDSYYNVMQCLEIGFPALLIDRPLNKNINTPFKIYSLTYDEIKNKYYELF